MNNKNRLTWTDVDWAKHFNCPVGKIAQYREWANKHYSVQVRIDAQTGKWDVFLDEICRHKNGTVYPVTVVLGNQEFERYSDCAKYAREEFIPDLELSILYAKKQRVPQSVLQMLTLRER